MASIGHPIVGDIAYGSKVESERIMLHAASLTCSIGGKEITFISPVPPSFS
jgi:23S rRNA-/tRNA-specific pseudouridylate synthase